MKFELRITDASAEQIAAVMNILGKPVFPATTSVVPDYPAPVPTIAPAISSPAAMPVTVIPGNWTEPVPPANSVPPVTITGISTAVPMPHVPSEPVETVNTNAPAFDANGIPHDERIHSNTKGLNANGTWRKRRGVADTVYAAVEAELKARAAGVPAGMPIALGTPYTPPTPLYQPMPPPLPEHVHIAPMPLPVQHEHYAPPAPLPIMPINPEPPKAIDFHGFMQLLTAQMQNRDASGQPSITAAYLIKVVDEIKGAFNTHLNAITDIAANPAMIEFAIQILRRDGKINA